MRYTVVWRETALQQLARIWLLALDRIDLPHENLPPVE